MADDVVDQRAGGVLVGPVRFAVPALVDREAALLPGRAPGDPSSLDAQLALVRSYLKLLVGVRPSGAMLRLTRKRFSGSYSAFTRRRRP